MKRTFSTREIYRLTGRRASQGDIKLDRSSGENQTDRTELRVRLRVRLSRITSPALRTRARVFVCVRVRVHMDHGNWVRCAIGWNRFLAWASACLARSKTRLMKEADRFVVQSADIIIDGELAIRISDTAIGTRLKLKHVNVFYHITCTYVKL